LTAKERQAEIKLKEIAEGAEKKRRRSRAGLADDDELERSAQFNHGSF